MFSCTILGRESKYAWVSGSKFIFLSMGYPAFLPLVWLEMRKIMQEALGFLDKMPLAVGAGDLNFAFSLGNAKGLLAAGAMIIPVGFAVV